MPLSSPVRKKSVETEDSSLRLMTRPWFVSVSLSELLALSVLDW